jgi:hypothetical protein
VLVALGESVHCHEEILETDESKKFTPPPQGFMVVENTAVGLGYTVTAVVRVLLQV